MTRFAIRTWQTLLDVIALATAYVLAYAFRFDWFIPVWARDRLLDTLPYVVAIQYAAMAAFGTTRYAWRYVGLREAMRIMGALAAGSLTFVVLRLIAAPVGQKFAADASRAAIPLGISALYFVLGTGGVVGIRLLRRLMAERRGKRALGAGAHKVLRTVLVGAGQGGVLVAREAEARPDLGILPVGFADDDPIKVGTLVHGIAVLGTTKEIRDICQRTGAEQVLITIARATGKEVRRIIETCETANLPVKIIPAMHEIVGGKISLSHVRNVAIDDLLRREPVRLDETAIAAAVKGRGVLVTGAGGSIGSELCRQVARFGPARLVLVERAENALFEIHRELVATFPDIKIVPAIADICDAERMEAVFRAESPALVFHAAAHKHVPMMEWNPGEAIKNNVLGTELIARLAHEHKVETFVLISTDKAVNPTSIMGATKRLAEMVIQAFSQRSKTRFSAVRFGNVLGSAGSVVPIFREQIAKGGPVTVTHPQMKRYFMTIPEASQLVLQAATMGRGGEIFILDMGEPVKIVDLARDLITLSGLRPGEDIEIQFTGIRPGEKLFEELSVAEEKADKTAHPKIFVGRLTREQTLGSDAKAVRARIEALAEAAARGDNQGFGAKDAAGDPKPQAFNQDVRRRLGELIPELTDPAPNETTPRAPAVEARAERLSANPNPPRLATAER